MSLIAGSPVRFASLRHARNHGVAIIFQELSPVPDLTLAENILLGREPRMHPHWTGLAVDRVKVAVYKLGGMLSAVAGLIVTARLDSVQPNAGLGYELNSIAAVVIGGTSLSGGRGSIIGILNNGPFLLNVSPFWQQVVKGFVILAAVAIDRVNRKVNIA